MKILGIDIGGIHAAFLLDHRPEDIHQFINSPEFVPFKFEPNEESLLSLIALEPDLVVFEPSGYHYEVLIVQYLKKHGIAYKQCTGTRLANYRKSLGLGKSDRYDAFSIALYTFDKLNENGAFLSPCNLEDMRRGWIERDNLLKIRTGLINRLKQTLVHDYPEVANFTSQRKWGEKPSELFRWLGGMEISKRRQTYYDTHHQGGNLRTGVKDKDGKMVYKKIEREGTYGRGIDGYARILGKQLAEIETYCQDVELRLSEELKQTRFEMYQKVFDRFDFSESLRVIWLTRIYPFEQFLDDELKAIRTERISARGKPVTKHVSLGRFKAALGAGTMPNTSGLRGERNSKHFLKRKRSGSGDAPEKLPMGDRLCRKSFFMWATRRIENGRSKSEFSEMLKRKSDKLKADGKNIYQRLGNLHGYTARLVFRELIKEVRSREKSLDISREISSIVDRPLVQTGSDLKNR
jgi:Transposase